MEVEPRSSRLASPVVAAVAALVSIGGVVMMGLDLYFLGLPGWSWLVIGLCLFFLSVGFLIEERLPVGLSRSERNLSSNKKNKGVEFYSDQPAMIEATGGLSSELKDMRNGWVAWESGRHLLRQGDHIIKHIDRMLIYAPGFLSSGHAGRAGDRQWADHASNAIDAQVKALDAGIEVRTTKRPLLNCVINDPHAEDAWARVQVQLWPLGSTHWPGFRVDKKDSPDLFNRIVKAYEGQWEAARPIQGPGSSDENDRGPVSLVLRNKGHTSLLRLRNNTDEMTSFWARVVISEDPNQFFPASRKRAYAPGKSYFACWEDTGIARTDLHPGGSDEATLLKRDVVDEGSPPTLKLVWPHCGQGGTENEPLVSSKTWIQGQEAPGVEVAVTIETRNGVAGLPLQERYRVTSEGFLKKIDDPTG